MCAVCCPLPSFALLIARVSVRARCPRPYAHARHAPVRRGPCGGCCPKLLVMQHQAHRKLPREQPQQPRDVRCSEVRCAPVEPRQSTVSSCSEGKNKQTRKRSSHDERTLARSTRHLEAVSTGTHARITLRGKRPSRFAPRFHSAVQCGALHVSLGRNISSKDDFQ